MPALLAGPLGLVEGGGVWAYRWTMVAGTAVGALGLIPLPSRWRIEFCEPIEVSGLDPELADDRRVVLDLGEQVRETIQRRLYDNLVKRGSTFL